MERIKKEFVISSKDIRKNYTFEKWVTSKKSKTIKSFDNRWDELKQRIKSAYNVEIGPNRYSI